MKRTNPLATLGDDKLDAQAFFGFKCIKLILNALPQRNRQR